MPKNQNFSDIKVNDTTLSKVGAFKAIVSPGKKRPLLDEQKHHELVKNKYNKAREMDDHITLFRLSEKKGLAQKETKEHTVPGPEWTPPSSVGFVMGGLSKAHRFWLATEPDCNGLVGEKGEVSIYAREIETALVAGWSAREPKDNEQYGRTGRGPRVVLTPPPSPVPTDDKHFQTIMDVKAEWHDIPYGRDSLMYYTTPVTFRLDDILEDDFGMVRECFDDGLIEIILDKRIFPLFEEGRICILEMCDMSYEVLKDMLSEKHILKLIAEDKAELPDIYKLETENKEEYKILSEEFYMSLPEIINLLKDSPKAFYAIAKDNVVNFYRKYQYDICIEDLIKIYESNRELFNALIKDSHDLIEDLGLEEFIDQFKAAQVAINNIPEEERDCDAYDIIREAAIKDGCPEGFCSDGDESGYSEGEFSDNEDEISLLGVNDSGLEGLLHELHIGE